NLAHRVGVLIDLNQSSLRDVGCAADGLERRCGTSNTSDVTAKANVRDGLADVSRLRNSENAVLCTGAAKFHVQILRGELELIHKRVRELASPGAAEVLARRRNVIGEAVRTSTGVREDLALLQIAKIAGVLGSRTNGEARAPFVLSKGFRDRALRYCRLEEHWRSCGSKINHIPRTTGEEWLPGRGIDERGGRAASRCRCRANRYRFRT